MAFVDITERDMIAYLLGQCREETAARIDELSFIDDEFAARIEAVERDLVDSYASGELEPEHRRQFEIHYLRSPLRREKLQFAETLRDFALKSQQPARLVGAAGVDRPSFWSSLLAWRPALQFGFAAAALLVMLAAGWVWFRTANGGFEISQNASVTPSVRPDGPVVNRSPVQNSMPQAVITPAPDNTVNVQPDANAGRPAPRENTNREAAPRHRESGERQAAPAAPPRIIALVLSPQLRSGSSTANLTVPADAARVAARLELEPNNFSSYVIELREQSSGRVVWRSGRMGGGRAGTLRSLNASVPAKQLKAGMYVFTVAGIMDDGQSETIGDYAFNIVR